MMVWASAKNFFFNFMVYRIINIWYSNNDSVEANPQSGALTESAPQVG